MKHDFDPFIVVLATRNQGKIKEILSIFQDVPIVFKTLDAFPNAPEVEEDGATLEENAQKKAYEIAKATGHVALADDSGLEVAFLDGAPGVISARWAGVGCSYADNCNKLLKLLKSVPSAHRKACFRSVIAIAVPGGATQTVEGRLDGFITDRARGTEGFGYDPVFLDPESGMTLAEMGPAKKNAISHRAKALAAIRPILLKLRESILHHYSTRAKRAPREVI